MDLTDTIEPKSDQLNADDLMAGEQTFTIEKVTAGDPDQPVNIHLTERPGRPYRPSKSMRRVLVQAWGARGEAYVGRRLTLYRDPNIKFGGIAVGGIVISHLSHIDGPVKVSLTVTRGKKQLTTVKPLKDAPQPDPIEKALTDSWDDVERMRKAVAHLAEIDHPRHQDAADRLAELEGAES